MPVSPTRNSISVEFDGDVWRSKLGVDGTGVTSVASDPFDAIALTLGKAREQNWAFDNTHAKAPEAPPAKPAPVPPKPAPTPGKPADAAPSAAH